jgi:hypothetical protein
VVIALAFPDPDEDIRTYLLRYAAHFDVFDVQAYFLTFFGVLFTQIRSELDRLVTGVFETSGDLAAWWRDHLTEGKNRGDLYRSVTRQLSAEGMEGHLHFRNGLVVQLPPYEYMSCTYINNITGGQTGRYGCMASETTGRQGTGAFYSSTVGKFSISSDEMSTRTVWRCSTFAKSALKDLVQKIEHANLTTSITLNFWHSLEGPCTLPYSAHVRWYHIHHAGSGR